MGKFLFWYLLVTGGTSLLVMAMPWIVMLGLMALILPGMILSLMPTAFLWGLIFAAIRVPARLAVGDIPAGVAAAAVTAAIVILVPQTLNAPVHAAIAAEGAGDHAPAAAIAIRGVVQVSLPQHNARYEAGQPIPCDLLCHALLFTPGVQAVIMVDDRPSWRRERTFGPAQFRLEKKAGGCTPGEAGLSDGWTPRKRDDLVKSWQIRQAAGECIVRETPDRTPDLRIRIERRDYAGTPDWSIGPSPIALKRLVIAVQGGKSRELMRRSFAWSRPLFVPLSILPEGNTETFHFQWGRKPAKDYGGPGWFDPLAVLGERTSIALEVDEAALGDGVRAQLAAALADPARPAGDAAFDLAPQLFKELARTKAVLRPGDADLLVRAIADPRVTEFGLVWDALRKLDDARLRALRGPIVERLLALPYHTGVSPGPALGGMLTAMPAGSFATLTADEERLLADPEKKRWASGLIERLSDQGAAAVPRLAALIGNRETQGSAYQALCTLGPVAASALPQVEAALKPHQQGDREWQLLLARLGRPVESFRVPPNVSWKDAQLHDWLRQRLARIEREGKCR